MSEIERIGITKSQYRALNAIRGLDPSVHYMVIAAKQAPSGYVLEGTSETFDHLVRDLSDEILYELAPRSRLKHLRSLMTRVAPDTDLW